METSDEDKLIKNGLMFIYVRQKKTVCDKIVNIQNVLNEGADINCLDGNDKNNTVLHIATQKSEKDLVLFLLKNGALLTYNADNKTPIHIANEINTDLSKEIATILTEYGRYLPRHDDLHSSNKQVESARNKRTNLNNNPDKILYSKRAGTSGVSGQFYETKLLGLVQHRALNDKDIEECYLAANIKDIGDFDDVCFRFKMNENGKTKHAICFMQAKHREDPDKARLTVASVRSIVGQFSLAKYFDSFLKIRQKFLTNTKNNDPMFKGEFEDIDCYFILYTPLKENFERKLSGNAQVCKKMLDFIYTGERKKEVEDIFQFDYENKDIEYLTKYMQQERIKFLGKVFMSFILSKPKEMMTNDLIQIYHPALARYVIKLRKVRDPNYFEGQFKDEFFYSDDDLLVILKETLYKEIVFNRSKKLEVDKETVKENIKAIAKNPCPATISILIGEIIYFDDKTNKLCLDLDKKSRKKFKQEDIREITNDLQKIQITPAMVKEAIEITGKIKLKALTFQVPYTFGNTDFPSNLKDEEIPKERLDFLANKFYLLINEKKQQLNDELKNGKVKEIDNLIVIDICNDNVGPKKILEHSHLNTKGIGGTVGNLLEYDIQNQMFLFNTTEEALQKNAKYLLHEIKKRTADDLTYYTFRVKMNNFPRISFSANQNDRNLAQEFLNKLWFFTNQAKEETVERILKKEIAYHYNAHKHQNQFLFRVHSDAIFLRYHDEIQKWWKSQTQARYLTKTDTIFEEAKKDIIDNPVLTVLNVMFIRTLKKFDIQFNNDAINFMTLNEMTKNKKILNIVSDAVILSATKLMQTVELPIKYTFINLDYVHILPENDYSTMMAELKEVQGVTLVIISEETVNEQLQDTLNKIIRIFSGNIIIITDKILQVESEQITRFVVFNDVNVNLGDLDKKSQRKILEEYKVRYQGKEVTLNTIIDENSKNLVNAKVLWAILNNNKIEIGQILNSHKYDEIKDYYISRSLFRKGEEYEVNTFNDLNDKTVLITSKPCMGKTTLLTHLALETKKIDPKSWIVRINLSTYSNEFAEWQDGKIQITNIIRFLSKAALKNANETKNLEFIEFADKTISVNSENASFELNCFIHFYNNGKVIFLFDGFEKICLHHTKEGIQLFNTLQQANQRMWITCNCYVINILERKFGPSYKLDTLSTMQQESFLSRFWKTNLKLEKFNHEQLNNINLFFEYLSKTFNAEKQCLNGDRPLIPFLSIPLHIVYLSAVEYFKNEVENLSPRFLRETLKKKWRLNSYTNIDRYLRTLDENENPLELAGTPLHMYIAANYFKIQIKEKFAIHFNGEEVVSKSKVYLNVIKSYERFLKVNMKHICEIENKNIAKSQEQAREDFIETHKKLALYAICKESDVSKLLTEPEILEVKRIIKGIESGEIKTSLIDCVVDGIPRFYNYLFAEYFLVEFAADLIKRAVNRNVEHLDLQSLWDFVVNGILLLCPPGVRNAFDYKLKYDPELAKIASNENSDKIIFDLILKQNKKAEINRNDNDSSLSIAINEGLANVTNLLLKSAGRFVDNNNVEGFLSVIKTGAFVLGAVNPSWKELTDNALHCIRNVDSKKLLEILNSDQTEHVSRTLTSFCADTELGRNLHQTVRNNVCEPIRRNIDNLIAFSADNENLTTLVETLPYHLPDIVNSLFGKK